MGRPFKLGVALTIGALMLAGGTYAFASSSARTIVVCVSHTSGTLYKARTCARHDRKLSWNKQGTRGSVGPRGAQGLQGPRGPQGLQGARGLSGNPGAPGAPAVIASTRLNIDTAEATTTSTSFVQVENLGHFTKHQSKSVLQVTYDTQMSAPSGDYCFLQLRVDGLNDQGGSSATVGTGSEATEIDGLAPATVFAVFTGVPAGTHTLSVWERSASGGACTENTGGWPRSAFVEESSP
jgi:hypothetical protein